MFSDPLIYRILVFCTLLVGLLSLLEGLRPHHSHGLRAHRSKRLVSAFFGDEPIGQLHRAVTPLLPARTRVDAVHKTDEEWKAQLTDEQYQVTRHQVTERPFTGEYWDHHADGTYHCVGCGLELFHSGSKFDSGTGWPSFCQPTSPSAVSELKNISYGTVRTEVVCSRCEAHLGHLFTGGPEPTGLRYCVNSAALEFSPAARLAVN